MEIGALMAIIGLIIALNPNTTADTYAGLVIVILGAACVLLAVSAGYRRER